MTAKVIAKNLVGDSDESSTGGLAVIPNTPAAVTLFVTEAQSTGSITFSWTAGDDGGSPITDYTIEWDLGDGSTFASVQPSNGLVTSYTQSSDLISGATHVFKVLAKNVIGTGTGATHSVIAAAEPDAPTGVTTTDVGPGASVTIEWTAPASNGGSILTGYLVYVQAQHDSSWHLDTANCDMSLAPSAISCTIPYSTLVDVAKPFLLVSGDTVVAKVVARNAVDDSPASTPGGSAVVPSAPSAVASIITVA